MLYAAQFILEPGVANNLPAEVCEVLFALLCATVTPQVNRRERFIAHTRPVTSSTERATCCGGAHRPLWATDRAHHRQRRPYPTADCISPTLPESTEAESRALRPTRNNASSRESAHSAFQQRAAE